MELIGNHFKKIAEIRDEVAKQAEEMRLVGLFDNSPRLGKLAGKIIKELGEYLEGGKKWRRRP